MNLEVLTELIKPIAEVRGVTEILNGAAILKLAGKVYLSTLTTSSPKPPVLLCMTILATERGVLSAILTSTLEVTELLSCVK